MKVYILVDSEGSACCVREPGEGRAYGLSWQVEYTRQQATREAAAAVLGAQDAGADDIVVHDAGFIRGHTPPGLTLHYDELPRGIRIAMGQVAIPDVVDASFDAAILIGHHAMAGMKDGVMAHTFSAVTIEGMSLNGKPIGEIGVEALVLGGLGIPVVFVASDTAGCREACDWLGPIETVETKQGICTHGAVSCHPADACDRIRAGVKRALEHRSDYEPLRCAPPIELRTDCFTEEQASTRCARKGGRMVGPRSFIVTAGSADRLAF